MLKAGLMCGEALSEQGVWGTQTLQIKEREGMKTGPGLVLQDLFSERNYLAGVHMHGVWGWGWGWGGVQCSRIQCVRGSLFVDTECEVGIG